MPGPAGERRPSCNVEAEMLWNGADVVAHAHVSGRGGPQSLDGAWSEPLNRANNLLCVMGAAEDDPRRCPFACLQSHSVRTGRRLRKAIHTMSDDEWQKVVSALWVLRTVKAKEGRERYGPQYRDIDFHILRHVLGTLPGLDLLARGVVDHLPMDVTGGAAHTYTWHALFTMELESSLLLVDPSISGLPYMDWGAMRSPEFAAVYRSRLGVGDAELSPTQRDDLGDMGSLDVLMAWKEYERTHGGESICTRSANRSCEPRLLMDGSFAGWPVPSFNWPDWYAEQSTAVRSLFSHVNDWADSIVGPLVHRGQLR